MLEGLGYGVGVRVTVTVTVRNLWRAWGMDMLVLEGLGYGGRLRLGLRLRNLCWRAWGTGLGLGLALGTCAGGLEVWLCLCWRAWGMEVHHLFSDDLYRSHAS